MNCPTCGAEPHHTVVTVSTFYDPETGEYFRKSRCSSCGVNFYSVEYALEYSEDLEQMLGNCRRSVANDQRLQSSIARFKSYRDQKQKVRQLKRKQKGAKK